MDTFKTPNLDSALNTENSLQDDLSDLKKKLEIQVNKEKLEDNTKSADFLKQSLAQLALLESELVNRPEKKEKENIEEIKNKRSTLKKIHTSFNAPGWNVEQAYIQLADQKRQELQQNVSSTATQMWQERPWLSWLVKRALNQ